MTLTQRVVATMIRIYPAAWRADYGAELQELLLNRPLTLAALADVVWNGLVQRARALEWSTVCGLAAMATTLTALVWNIVAPAGSEDAFTNLLRASGITLPPIRSSIVSSDGFVLVLFGCGAWVQLRNRGPLSKSGHAAARVGLMAGAPVALAGVLMLAGVLDVIVLSPGAPATTFAQHGLAYTYINAQQVALTPWTVIVSPLLAVPKCWLWGVIGGSFGKWIPLQRWQSLAAR
jgi:hypothetical protein